MFILLLMNLFFLAQSLTKGDWGYAALAFIATFFCWWAITLHMEQDDE